MATVGPVAGQDYSKYMPGVGSAPDNVVIGSDYDKPYGTVPCYNYTSTTAGYINGIQVSHKTFHYISTNIIRYYYNGD